MLGITVFLIVLSVASSRAERFCSSSVCIPGDYKKLDLPSNDTVRVNITLFLMDIYLIDHKTYTFNLNLDGSTIA